MTDHLKDSGFNAEFSRGIIDDRELLVIEVIENMDRRSGRHMAEDIGTGSHYGSDYKFKIKDTFQPIELILAQWDVSDGGYLQTQCLR
jgi:hypothetical protein